MLVGQPCRRLLYSSITLKSFVASRSKPWGESTFLSQEHPFSILLDSSAHSILQNISLVSYGMLYPKAEGSTAVGPCTPLPPQQMCRCATGTSFSKLIRIVIFACKFFSIILTVQRSKNANLKMMHCPNSTPFFIFTFHFLAQKKGDSEVQLMVRDGEHFTHFVSYNFVWNIISKPVAAGKKYGVNSSGRCIIETIQNQEQNESIGTEFCMHIPWICLEFPWQRNIDLFLKLNKFVYTMHCPPFNFNINNKYCNIAVFPS